MASGSKDRRFLLGFGSPLVDLRAEVSEEFLRRNIPGGKGGTLHVSREELEALVSLLPVPPGVSPGGSAGNTVSALNRLGAASELLGRAGDDDYGRFVLEKFRSAGGRGEYVFRVPGEATGACLALTTPDGERTMRSCLGASQELDEAGLAQVDFSRFEVVLIEGYMVACPLFEAVLSRAHEAGCRIAFDPGSFELARRFRERFTAILDDFADILFVNRAEAESLCGAGGPEELAERLRRRVPLVALKLGADGALICGSDGGFVAVPAVHVEHVVDTTAAGDMFAAGFLYGMHAGCPLELSGRFGARLASEIVRRSGTELAEDVWRTLGRDFAAAAAVK